MITVSQIRNGKILVVDDKQLNVDLMKRMLADGGYTSVDSTTNPDEVSLRTLEKKCCLPNPRNDLRNLKVHSAAGKPLSVARLKHQFIRDSIVYPSKATTCFASYFNGIYSILPTHSSASLTMPSSANASLTSPIEALS